jgi:hypothetical protein
MLDPIEKQAEILNKLVDEVDQDNRKMWLTEVVSLSANTPFGIYAQGALAEENVDKRIEKMVPQQNLWLIFGSGSFPSV